MQSLTAIILTKNEEMNIGECLKSIRDFASRAVVVDCGSTDRTVEIAREMGADVYFHEFTYYAAQFNWGIDNTDIDTEWILRLDADERMTPEVIREAGAIMQDPQAKKDGINGITMESIFYFMGKPLMHGVKKKRKMMIFRRGIGRIEDRKRDAHSLISEGQNVSIKSRFLHYDFKDLSSYIKRYNWYAAREMQDYIAFREGASQDIDGDKHVRAQRKKKFGVYYRAPKYIRCWLWFIYNYIFRLGFLDGVEGFLFHYFECAWYRMLVDARIYEYDKTGKGLDELKALD
ncbi:MAG: glycosyltransferase family 2 protein [Clostridiales bacterium]|nr:glycosyltransferase family 2 protein [Clostridiales bacterium]